MTHEEILKKTIIGQVILSGKRGLSAVEISSQLPWHLIGKYREEAHLEHVMTDGVLHIVLGQLVREGILHLGTSTGTPRFFCAVRKTADLELELQNLKERVTRLEALFQNRDA